MPDANKNVPVTQANRADNAHTDTLPDISAQPKQTPVKFDPHFGPKPGSTPIADITPYRPKM